MSKSVKPLTPEQRAKQAERRTLIGEKGEFFAMQYEVNRLQTANEDVKSYPQHIALINSTAGYDILSTNEGEPLFIEVKTTTRLKSDPQSKYFFISSNEYNFFLENDKNYKLYRVYDIDGTSEVEVQDLRDVKLEVESYKGLIQ